MPARSVARWIALAGVAGVAALYMWRVSDAPIYLHHDEVLNALNAYDIATTGRDMNGRFLPLYFYVGAEYWATPIVAYTLALVLLVAPLTDSTIRLVSVAVGLCGLALMYVVARRVFARRDMAALATGLLALTPAYFIHSRVAFDQIYPLPFVLGWLWCLSVYLERRRVRVLALGGLVLGVGLYTYLGSLIMMPVYVLITWLALALAGERSARVFLVPMAAFTLPALLLIPWHLAYPAQIGQQMHMYAVYDLTTTSAWQGLGALVRYSSLAERASVFHQGFNPSMLFLTGGSSVINATGRAGVLLLPFAVWLPIGIYRVLTRRSEPFTWVLLLGFLTAPLAGTVVGEVTVNRMLVMLPFAALLAALGVEQLRDSARALPRRIGLALLVLAPVQFAFFHGDYLNDYRMRSRLWFERNIRDAIGAVMAQDARSAVGALYISTQEVPFIDAFTRYFLLSRGRADLLSRVVPFSASEVDPASIPAGAFVLANGEGRLKDTLVAAGFREVATIREPTGEASFSLLTR